MNPLKTIWGTIVTGVVLALIIAFGLSSGAGNHLAWTIWLHVLAGVAWIGLLYYFNFIQVPAMAEAAGDTGGPGPAAIGKYVAPRALLWFRWAAIVTWVTGAAALWKLGILGAAFTFDSFAFNTGASIIGAGAWMGTIMLFNVWVLIWPNQKKVLGLVQASDQEKAKAKNIAFLASRTNTMLSIPMLLCMISSPFHNGGLPF